MTQWNYIVNPRFHLGEAGWADPYDTATWGRVTSVPWGALPEGSDAAGAIQSLGGWLLSDLSTLRGDNFGWTITWGVSGASPADVEIAVMWFDAEGNQLDTLTGLVFETGLADLNQWLVASGVTGVPADATQVAMYVRAPTSGTLYFTLVRLGGELYADGGSDLWAWLGAAHDSVSFGHFADEVWFTPRPDMGGNGVDVLEATIDLDRKGGFTAAALEVVPPRGVARHESSILTDVEIRDPATQHVLWEGRVEDPELGPRFAERHRISCGGYIGYLEDDEAFVRNYVDHEMRNWDTRQATRFADRFDVRIVDDDTAGDPKLVLKAREGVPIPEGANARAFWYPFKCNRGTAATHFRFHITAADLDSTLRIALYAIDGAPGSGTKTLIWSRATDCTDLAVDLGTGDIPAGTQALMFRIEQITFELTYLVYGTGDPETWGMHYGAEITVDGIYGSPLGTNVTPERVMADLAAAVADEDHLDMPDVSGLVIGQLLFAEPTTRRAAMEQVNSLLDWDYGMSEGQTFFFRKPWTAVTVPDSELILVSSADPNLKNGSWPVKLDWEGVYNRVVAYYTKPNGFSGVVTVSDTDGPLGDYMRTLFLDLRESCDDATTCETIAQRVLDDSLWPKATGSPVLTGDCHLANGAMLPAIFVHPGMMIRNLDVDGGPYLIEHCSHRTLAREATLTIGRRSDRLDMWLARQQMSVKAKAKKKAG